MKEKPSYYAILTAEIRYDKNIKPNAKLLYAEITALCNMNGECFASNKYFSELYGKSKTSISIWIKELIANGYISARYTYKDGTKEIDKRYLSILKGGEEQKVKEVFKKSLKSNNINNNNTSINNISIRKEDFEKSVKKSTNGYGYDIDLLNEFCDYWTEPNKSNSRMKFEMQTTFDISLRLKTWAKNQAKWNKGTSKIDSQINEYIKGKELLK